MEFGIKQYAILKMKRERQITEGIELSNTRLEKRKITGT